MIFANVKAHVKQQEVKEMVPLCKLHKHYQIIMLIIFFLKIKV